jgi:hypothetical protein
MRAIDIINFINEDKFSKYTLKQIYDELGKEDFFDYLSNTALKIIKNIDKIFNSVKVEISNRVIYYNIPDSATPAPVFMLRYAVTASLNHLYISHSYKQETVYGGIGGEELKFSDRLKEELPYCHDELKSLLKK